MNDENEFANDSEIISRRIIGKSMNDIGEDLDKAELILLEAVIVITTSKLNKDKIIAHMKAGKDITDYDAETPTKELIKECYYEIMETFNRHVEERIDESEFEIGGVGDARRFNSPERE